MQARRRRCAPAALTLRLFPLPRHGRGIRDLLLVVLAAGTFQSSALAAAEARPAVTTAFTELETRQPVAVESWRGRMTLVSFWAWWCGPCLIELRGLPALVAANPQLRFVTAAVDSRRRARNWLARHPVPGAAALHVDGAPANILRSLGNYRLLLPFNIVVDANGRICASSVYRLDAGQVATLLAQCRAG